jgi:hypothetical protein
MIKIIKLTKFDAAIQKASNFKLSQRSLKYLINQSCYYFGAKKMAHFASKPLHSDTTYLW